MGPPNIGPDWAWRAGCIFALLGMIGTAVGVVIGIVWIVNHVTITW